MTPVGPGVGASFVLRSTGSSRTSRASRSRRFSASSGSSASSSSPRTKGRSARSPRRVEAIEPRAVRVEPLPGRWVLPPPSGLAERHGIAFEEVVVAAGADAVIGYACQAALDPGDEVVTPLAVVPELRARPAEARRRPGPRPAPRRPRRRRRAPRRRDRAHEARIRPHREQPDGNDDRPRRPRAVPRRRPRSRPHGRRRGVLRVRRRPVVPGRHRGGGEAGPAGARAADVLEDLRSRRATRRLRGRAGVRDRGDPQGAAARSTSRRPPRRPRSRASKERPSSPAAGLRTASRWRCSTRCSASTASSRSRLPRATSCSWTSATDAAALNDALLRRGVIVRPMGSFGAPSAPADHRRNPRGDRIPRGAARRRRSGGLTPPSGRRLAFVARARRRHVSMRTTLKRGVGRGAALNGADGPTARPPARSPRSRSTGSRPPPPRSGSLARRPDPGLGGARARGRRRRHRRRRLPLPPRVGRRCRAEDPPSVKEAAQGARRRRSPASPRPHS